MPPPPDAGCLGPQVQQSAAAVAESAEATAGAAAEAVEQSAAAAADSVGPTPATHGFIARRRPGEKRARQRVGAKNVSFAV